jgi:hypothetical protein
MRSQAEKTTRAEKRLGSNCRSAWALPLVLGVDSTVSTDFDQISSQVVSPTLMIS